MLRGLFLEAFNNSSGRAFADRFAGSACDGQVPEHPAPAFWATPEVAGRAGSAPRALLSLGASGGSSVRCWKGNRRTCGAAGGRLGGGGIAPGDASPQPGAPGPQPGAPGPQPGLWVAGSASPVLGGSVSGSPRPAPAWEPRVPHPRHFLESLSSKGSDLADSSPPKPCRYRFLARRLSVFIVFSCKWAPKRNLCLWRD